MKIEGAFAKTIRRSPTARRCLQSTLIIETEKDETETVVLDLTAHNIILEDGDQLVITWTRQIPSPE